MRAHVHVYEVEKPPPPVRAGETPRPFQPAPPQAAEGFGVDGTDHDALKLEARRYLEEKGFEVRSVSWGPGITPKDPARLIAYVHAKKG